jgi:uncharacterized protein YbbC (DUF1343 family)
MKNFKFLWVILFLSLSACSVNSADVIVGAERSEEYFPLLKDQRIAVFSNHTGMVGGKHLLDLLVENDFNVVTIFSPEHGFRGKADAGEHVSSSIDEKTGIPIRSLYGGKSSALTDSVMNSFDLLIVDIQDVGLRFYTYYITMVKLMNACTNYGQKMLILDRPNPNGFYVDGPVLDMKYKSGVGGLPIPVVHGMTLGELGQMVNGEGWLPGGKVCDLTVITCENYTHQTRYELPVPPSPNLPDMKSVYLYPSMCYFEATPVSLGRGTPWPFQVYGHPAMKGYEFSFSPRSMPGAKHPPQHNNVCFGVDLTSFDNDSIISKGIDLTYLIDAYRNLQMGDKFFSSFFEKLIGVGYVRKMIEEGKSADQIKAMWADDVERFKAQRRPYLLYPE